MRSRTDCCAPRPSATIAMTAPTPITIPSMVKKERSLFARSASSATETVPPISMLRPSAGTPAATPTAAAAAGASAAPAATRPRDAGYAAPEPLADPVLGIGTGGLGLRDTQENHLLSFLDPV